MKVLFKPINFDGVWRVSAENLEETTVLKKICMYHNVANSDFSVRTEPLIQNGLLKDGKPKDTPVPKYDRPTWEVRTKDQNIFLANRFDKESAENCAKAFSSWWPGGCVAIELP